MYSKSHSATGTAAASEDFYVDLLMREWRLDEQSEVFQARVRLVLRELVAESQLVLRREPRLEVRVVPNRGMSVWAFFPCHRGRYNVRRFSMGPIPLVKPSIATEVLLVINAEEFERQTAARSQSDLRHHLGHVLVYLSDPKASNECSDARKKWRASVRESAAVVKKAAAASAMVRSVKAKAKTKGA